MLVLDSVNVELDARHSLAGGPPTRQVNAHTAINSCAHIVPDAGHVTLRMVRLWEPFRKRFGATTRYYYYCIQYPVSSEYILCLKKVQYLGRSYV